VRDSDASHDARHHAPLDGRPSTRPRTGDFMPSTLICAQWARCARDFTERRGDLQNRLQVTAPLQQPSPVTPLHQIAFLFREVQAGPGKRADRLESLPGWTGALQLRRKRLMRSPAVDMGPV